MSDEKFDAVANLLGPDGKPLEMKMTLATRLVLRALAWWRAFLDRD